ncbi:MAG TPA: hypothetical protein VMX17_09365 [Candidatus Glassbacteria bacterium]|nr:hypothetical protein [Candidatus Glassbacteria bacterium]
MKPFIVRKEIEKFGEFIVLNIIRNGTEDKTVFWGIYKDNKQYDQIDSEKTIFLRFLKEDEMTSDIQKS